MHVSANRSLRNLKTNQLELFGNVYIRRPRELLTADYARLDLNTERLIAEGNAVYYTPESVIYGTKMDFNYVSGTGAIENGRVENDQYTLVGQSLERLGEDEFLAQDADYTTCKDCPEAWKIHGETIRMTVEGYARITHMLIKINDTPLIYFPYVIIPVKTQRQTGLLFPKIRIGSIHGFQYIQPFFWAIGRSHDLTIGVGRLTARGYKQELEYRYALGSKSGGSIAGYFLKDRTYVAPYQQRFGLLSTHNLQLPWSTEFKLRWHDASDRDYARQFPEDIPGQYEPALVSEAGLARSGRDFSASITAKRIKRLLRPDLVGFDRQQVQELPSITMSSTDHRFFKRVPLYWGLSANFKRFWRQGGDFDLLLPPEPLPSDPREFTPGRDPLRRGFRLMFTPELYYTAHLGDYFQMVPSVQYRGFFYDFDKADISTLRRGYLVAQTELTTNFERVYGGAVKHRIRPALTYSVIPFIERNRDHPFSKQLDFGTGNVIGGTESGRQLDDFDVVPYSFNAPQYFIPIGHSLTYELGHSFILKSYETDNFSVIPKGRETERGMFKTPPGDTPTYRRVAHLLLGQTVNFVELRKNGGDEKPLSRAYAIGGIELNRINNSNEIYYYPYSKAFQLNTSITYNFARFRKRLLEYARSVSIGYSLNKATAQAEQITAGFTFSINDYFQVGMTRSMDLLSKKTLGTTGMIMYQSPSECYRVTLNFSQTIDRGIEVSPNLTVNLAGTGYSNFADPNALGGSMQQLQR